LKLFTEIFGHQQRAAPRTRIEIGLDVADRESDPAERRAAKALLRLCVHGPAGSVVNFADAEAEGLPKDVRTNLRNLVQRLVRDRQARWLKDDTCLVFDAAVADIESSLLEARDTTVGVEKIGEDQKASGKPRVAKLAGTDGYATETAFEDRQADTGPERGPESDSRREPPPAKDIGRRGSLDDYIEWEVKPRPLPAVGAGKSMDLSSDPEEHSSGRPFDFIRNRRSSGTRET
jgi:hypothetical protein